MDPQFFSILGLFPTREHARKGLNDPLSHRDDAPWKLGDELGSVVPASRRAVPASRDR